MTVDIMDIFQDLGIDTRPDSELTHDEILARNVRVVDLHFHSENPDEVENAVALYTDDIIWEAPARGIIMMDSREILDSYRKIFSVLAYRKATSLRRFATEQFVFDDQVAELVVVGDPLNMPNLPFTHGDEVSVRLVHCFELRDGRISREIAYELWRQRGSAVANDFIPEGSVVEEFPPIPGFSF